MAQFDIHDTPLLTLRRQYPYVMNLQSAVLQDSRERIVAPLVLAEATTLIRGRLIVPIWLEEGLARREYLVLIPALSSLSADALSLPVGSGKEFQKPIEEALRLLFFGL